jgi:hypothetical protein
MEENEGRARGNRRLPNTSERIADCWANRCGNPTFAKNHTERAEELRRGVDLRESELTGSDLAVMHDTLSNGRHGKS